MKYWASISTAALLAGAFSAQSAAADITAQQAWDAITALGESYGEQITGTPSMSGDTLTIRDAGFTFAAPEATITGTLGDIALKELGNGTVEVTAGTEFPMTMAITPEDGEDVDIAMVLRQSGLKTIVSGTPDDLAYDSSADTFAIALSEMKVDGEPLEMDMLISLAALAGKYRITQMGTMKGVTSALTAKALGMTLNVVAPEDETGHVNMSASIADLSSTNRSTLPVAGDFSDMAALLKAGMVADGQMTYGPAAMTFDFADEVESGVIKASASGGSLDIAMSGETMTYGGSQTGVDIAISGSQIPVPEITARMAETTFNLMMPIAKSDTPADFALLTALRGLTLGDNVWGLFDPAGTLPRDPANLVLDLSGKARLAFDMFDPAAAQQLTGAAGELHALDINDLELTVAGASLTGTGGFTFDNTDLTTFNGMPAPAGAANLKLTGGNGLMDKLVAMGLLPEDQVMGFRMMLGLFARPGEGDDTLVSEITVTDDGQVLANGQRLK
ncbi:DUF2125 domain-containing protein [Actibacterium sp. D379-3]